MSPEYAISLLKGGNYHFRHEDRPKFRGAGSVLVVDGHTALYMTANGLAEIHRGLLPISTEYFDPDKERAQRSKQRQAENDFIIQCVLAEQTNNNPTEG
jgi:hypothetical protein